MIGKKTYEVARGFDPWPYIGKRCVVLTHDASLEAKAKNGEQFFAGDPRVLLERLSSEGAKRVYHRGR